MLARVYGKWNNVYYYFRKWKKNGTLLLDLAILRELVCKDCGRKACPSLGIIDSQSIKNSEWGIPDKRFDGNKRIKDRKQPLVVDALGLLMCIVVTAANVHDSVAAERVIKWMVGRFPRLKKILADGGYTRERLSGLVKTQLGVELEVVTSSDEAKFKVIPKRWVVERSIAWLS